MSQNQPSQSSNTLRSTQSGGHLASGHLASGQPALDDVMLAMDVVDTLRHDEKLIARELAEEDREEELINRLRQIYESQGLEVSDRILMDGVAALREDRFAYTPPAPSLQVSLAKLYVRRGQFGKLAAAAVLLVVVAFVAYYFLVTQPANQARYEMAELLPQRLEQLKSDLSSPALSAQVTPFFGDVEAALVAQDRAAALQGLAVLDDIKAKLDIRYDIRIVSRQGTPSGVTRIPPENPDGQNYYLIVEAVAPDGSILPQEIVSEESGEARTVSVFGVRVPERVYQAVGRDKTDDGIIQNNILGSKARGQLNIDWAASVEGGRIFEW